MTTLAQQLYSLGVTKYLEKRASAASGWHAAAELGGLGLLAAPSVSGLAGHDWQEKNKHLAEVAGLGTLAAPTVHGLVTKSPNKGLIGRMLGRLK